LRAFFVTYFQPNFYDEYEKVLKENIFACMEFSKQSYNEILMMPVKRFHDYLKWKIDLEEKKQKQIEESTNYGKELKIPRAKFK
jgi:hypothetical protein